MEEKKVPRKTRADKGKTRGPQKATVNKSIQLEKLEAKFINNVITAAVARRYALALDPPGAEATEALARLLKALTSVPPFSYIQEFVRRLLPMSKGTGTSPVSDAMIYGKAWYDKNPDELERIYLADASIPDIPVMPKAAVAAKRQGGDGRIVFDPSERFQKPDETDVIIDRSIPNATEGESEHGGSTAGTGS